MRRIRIVPAGRIAAMNMRSVSCAFLVVAPVALSSAAAEAWRECADKYMRTVERALAGTTGSVSESLHELEKARKLLAAAPLPGGAELRSLLTSGRGPDRRIAVAVLSVVGRPDPSLVALALEGVDAQPLSVRLATAESVAEVDPAELPRVSRALVRAYSQERDSVVVAAALPAIDRLPSSDIVPLCVALARTEGTEVQRIGWMLAIRHLPRGLESLRAELSRKGASDALRALELEIARVERESPATKVVVDPTAKPLSPRQLQDIDEKMSLAEIVGRLGPPHHETGSGLCVFVWRVTDGREFWVGTSRCRPAERPIYAKFRGVAP